MTQTTLQIDDTWDAPSTDLVWEYDHRDNHCTIDFDELLSEATDEQDDLLTTRWPAYRAWASEDLPARVSEATDDPVLAAAGIPALLSDRIHPSGCACTEYAFSFFTELVDMGLEDIFETGGLWAVYDWWDHDTAKIYTPDGLTYETIRDALTNTQNGYDHVEIRFDPSTRTGKATFDGGRLHLYGFANGTARRDLVECWAENGGGGDSSPPAREVAAMDDAVVELCLALMRATVVVETGHVRATYVEVDPEDDLLLGDVMYHDFAHVAKPLLALTGDHLRVARVLAREWCGTVEELLIAVENVLA